MVVCRGEEGLLECVLVGGEEYWYMELLYMMEEVRRVGGEMVEEVVERRKKVKVKGMLVYMGEKGGEYWLEGVDRWKIGVGRWKLEV